MQDAELRKETLAQAIRVECSGAHRLDELERMLTEYAAVVDGLPEEFAALPEQILERRVWRMRTALKLGEWSRVISEAQKILKAEPNHREAEKALSQAQTQFKCESEIIQALAALTKGDFAVCAAACQQAMKSNGGDFKIASEQFKGQCSELLKGVLEQAFERAQTRRRRLTWGLVVGAAGLAILAALPSLFRSMNNALPDVHSFVTPFSNLREFDSSAAQTTPVIPEAPVLPSATPTVSPKIQTPIPDLKTPWENSLGMQFMPVSGTKLLFSIWLTRVQDFEAFVKATGYDAATGMYSLRSDGWKQRGDTWQKPGFAQDPTHPVCGVNWNDAKAFCTWLTEKERAIGLIAQNQAYRLPKDWEWSVAVGLNEARVGTPKDKNEKSSDADVYPWGAEWPPPGGAGNFAGEESKDGNTPSYWTGIAYFHDGFARTSPVGSFKANSYGLFDMSGNLWEWCEDFYDGQSGWQVLRGGSWSDTEAKHLLASFRFVQSAESRDGGIGYRVVLEWSTP